MQALKIFGILLTIIILINFNACKSDPFVIEVPGVTIPVDSSGNLQIVSIVESNPCDNGVISFQNQVLPILVAGCAYDGCHSTASHEDGVIMDNYTKIMKEVKSGDPNDSELYKVITENPNDEDFMPPSPTDPLTSQQINIIKTWIEQGANNTACNQPCNSDETSFANHISPIITEACYGCHQPNNALGNVNLEDYAHIKTFASNGQLLGTIKHVTGYSAMPTAGNQLTDCQIATIQNWIVEGALNN